MKNRNRQKKGKKRQKALLFVLIAPLLIVGLSIGAQGFSSYNYRLPDNGESFSCSTCHVGSDLNEFGIDFTTHDKRYDETLAARDSDGDNFTNEEEFNADPPTNPGDANSYPGGNNTNVTVAIPDNSAFIGPIDMKVFIPTMFLILTTLVIGGLIGLVCAEVAISIKSKLGKRKRRTKNG